MLFCYEIAIVSEAAQPAATSTPRNSYSLSLGLLEQLKIAAFGVAISTLSGAIAGYEKHLDTKSNEFQYAKLKIQVLVKRSYAYDQAMEETDVLPRTPATGT